MNRSQYMVDVNAPRLTIVQLNQGGIGKAGGREYTARLPKGSNVRIIGLGGDVANTHLITSMGFDRYEAVSPARKPAGQLFPKLNGVMHTWDGALTGLTGIDKAPVGWGGKLNLPWYDGEDFHITVGTYSALDVVTPVDGEEYYALCIVDENMSPADKEWDNYPHYFLIGDEGTTGGQQKIENEVDSKNGYSTHVERIYCDQPGTTQSVSCKQAAVRIMGYGGVRLRDNWADERIPAGFISTFQLDDVDKGWGQWLLVPDRGGVRLDVSIVGSVSFGMAFLGGLRRA